jgi:hypothetical protein
MNCNITSRQGQGTKIASLVQEFVSVTIRKVQIHGVKSENRGRIRVIDEDSLRSCAPHNDYSTYVRKVR